MPKQIIYTEDSLIAALRRHDNDAFKHLYLHYKNTILAVVSTIVTDEETANDILQEIFITAWKNIDKYDQEKGRLFTWLHTLARNTSINTLRSKNFKVKYKNENLQDYVYNIELKDPFLQNINTIGLRKQVHMLRSEYKAVLDLSYFNGYTQEEIAQSLGIPIGTVKTRLRNALIELRKQFV